MKRNYRGFLCSSKIYRMAEKEQELVVFQTENGALQLRKDINEETFWANQSDISRLFDRDQSVISRHIRNILKSKEVDENSNMQKMHITFKKNIL